MRQSLKGRTYILGGPNRPADGGDGDAAVIPAGEPVYAVRGYAPTFRLAAHHDARLILYEADMNPAARKGADVLDLEGKVVAISLPEGPTKTRPDTVAINRLSDPERVRELVEIVLAAPVGQSPYTSGLYALVGFEMADGTVTARWYASDPGVFTTFGGPRSGGYTISASGAFRNAIEELCRQNPISCAVTRGG